jgi:type II secretory pathway component GspD/PulD (secretin)
MKKKNLLSFVAILSFLFVLVPGIFGETARLINLDFKNTDMKDVLRALANQSGVSIIVDNDTTGKVTIHLAKVTLPEALDVISKNYKLSCVKSKNVYYVSPVNNSLLKVEFKEGFLTVEARDANIKELYEQICQKSGVNLVPSPDLKGKVSILINHSPLPDAIKTLFTQTHCMGEKIGKNTYVRPKTTQAYNFTVTYEKNLLTVDAKAIPIPVLARAITEKTGISIIPEQNVNDNATIYFQDLPFDEGMEALCQANNFNYYKEAQSRRIARKNGAYRIALKNSLLSIDADNVEIAEIFSEISRQTSINIMLDRDITGKVSAHFQALPMFQGLMTLVENQGWYIEKQANTYFVKKAGPENKDARIIYNPDTKLFNLDIRNGALAAIINEMAHKAGVNMVIINQVNWPVSNMRLRDLTLNQALDYLLKGTVFTYRVSNGVYMVGDGLLARPEVADFTDVKVYPVKYIKAEQLLNSLPPVFPRQDFLQLPNKNTLVLSAPPSVHARFANYLAQVDTVAVKEQTEMIRIKYLKAEDVLKMIPSSIPKNNISLIKESNALVVNDIPSTVARVKNYISTIDQVTPLIVFNISVLQITGENTLKFEGPSGQIKLPNGNLLNIATGSGAITYFKPGTSTSSTDTTLNAITALMSKGKAKVVANPTITTMAGYPASFNVSTNKSVNVASTKAADGTTTSSTVKEFKSGLQFKIVPWVSPNKSITMEIKPTITEFVETTSSSSAEESLPTINERSSETTIRVADGETFVISGLKNSKRTKTVSKVPILGDIPLIGLLFRNNKNSTTEDEYIIVITPTLVFNTEDKGKAEQRIQQNHNKDFNQDLNKLLSGGAVDVNDNKTKEKSKPKSKEKNKTKNKFKQDVELTPVQVPAQAPKQMQRYYYRKYQRGRFN